MINSLHYFKYVAGFAKPLTQTSKAERQALREFASGKKRLAEVGVFHGVNTSSFREVMAADAVLIAIDPFHRPFFGIRGYGWARRIAHREVSRIKRGSVVWIEDTGKNAPLRTELLDLLPVDFIFIDGDHSWEGLKGDWESWSPRVALNGIVALHDSFNCGGAGSERFTTEVILHDQRYERLRAIDSLTILRRRA
jgi:predicted O-methyltransferase YrrM